MGKRLRNSKPVADDLDTAFESEKVCSSEKRRRELTKPNKIGNLDKSRSDMSDTMRGPELSSV